MRPCRNCVGINGDWKNWTERRRGDESDVPGVVNVQGPFVAEFNGVSVCCLKFNLR